MSFTHFWWDSTGSTLTAMTLVLRLSNSGFSRATAPKWGAAMAAGGAFAYAVTIICNRELAKEHLGLATVLGVRFGIAGVVLLGVLAVRRAPLLPVPGERVRTVLLGAIGYMAEST